jgi:flagellar basal body-associated protein FliL
MRRALIAITVLALSAPAFAAEEKKKEGDAVGQYVDLVPLALPIVANGMVKNFIFLRVRVNLTKSADAPKMRDKEPYLRDALIHAGYRTPFTRSDSYLKVDDAKLSAALTKDATAILGPGKVASVQIMSQDPQRISGIGHP